MILIAESTNQVIKLVIHLGNSGYNELGSFGPAFLDNPLYLGGSLEYGNVFEDTDDIKIDGMLLGTSLFLGADTFLGPMYLGYGYTEGGSHALFLQLGGLF